MPVTDSNAHKSFIQTPVLDYSKSASERPLFVLVPLYSQRERLSLLLQKASTFQKVLVFIVLQV